MPAPAPAPRQRASRSTAPAPAPRQRASRTAAPAPAAPAPAPRQRPQKRRAPATPRRTAPREASTEPKRRKRPAPPQEEEEDDEDEEEEEEEEEEAAEETDREPRPTLVGDDGLPYPLLRDADNALDASRLRPDEAWPAPARPPRPPTVAALGVLELRAAWNVPRSAAPRRLTARIGVDGWERNYYSADGWTRARYVMLGDASWGDKNYYLDDDGRYHDFKSEAVCTAGPEQGDAATFWALFQLEDCLAHGLVEIDAVGVDDRRRVRLELSATAKAFALDAKLELEPGQRGFKPAWRTVENRDDARAGDVAGQGQQSGWRSFNRLLRSLCVAEGGRAENDAGTLAVEAGPALGEDACDATLNGFLGVPRQSSAALEAGLGSSFALGDVLDAVAIDDDGSPCEHGASVDAKGKLRSLLHPFQDRGVGWMVRRETRPDALTLHPSWTQLRSGRDVWYAHRFAGACSGTFFPAPLAATCGGCLCDDVGLGKSIQLIGLVLSNPAPPGWAVDALPATTTEPVAVKSTLLVCPAALLPQWEQELATHVKEGALTVTTYLGLGNKKMRLAAAPEPEADDEGLRRRRRRGEAAAAAAPADAGVEVLARKRHLFGDGDGAAPDLAACDVVLCSFETLRDELRKCHFDEDDGLPLSTPLGAVGFWRVVLDEAQLVCQTTSKAALMCSAILRRHAWVVTGTPINRSPDELHGLLAFLGVAPLSDKHVFDQLYLEPYKRRLAGSRGRLVGLLKGLMLRRGKDKPGVAAQVKLPPLVWETETLAPSPAERGAYRVARDALVRSHAAFSRTVHGAANAGRLLGQLNGDLTRLRQTVCHPSVVNVKRDGAKASGVVDENGEALAMSDVLRRLALKAEKDATRAAVAYLEARALHADRAGGESVDEILDDVAAKRKDLEAVEEDFSRWETLVEDLEVLRDTPPKRLTKKSFTSKALAKVLDKVDAGVLRRVADQARTAWRDKQASRNYLVRELENAAAAKDGAEVEASEPQCPICLEDRSPETAWCVSPCGHGGCHECCAAWVAREGSCAICKRPMTVELLYPCVERKPEDAPPPPSSDAAEAAAAGEWGSKLSRLLGICGARARRGDKVVVFSAWTRLLNLAGSALEAHDLPVASLVGSPEKKREALAAFARAAKNGGAAVLLVPLFGGASGAGGGGAAGLTLTHANTAVILEPSLTPGIEAQAAGRISRIGQTKAAKVIRLIVADTVEEKILEWQARRMDSGTNKSAQLSLNDFVQLGLSA